jgi:DNA-binding LacI/PurR family transcriptional regulator
MPTLEDVAARAEVSRALVSIVMRGAPGASEATRERVRAIAHELGYRPDSRAQLLANKRSRLLGVTLSLNNPFHTDVADGIYAAADAAGYQVVLSAVTSSRDPRAAVDTLLSYRCEALLLVGTLVGPTALTALAERQPVVVVGQPTRVSGIDVVRAADREGVGLAVDHLIGLGHRRIGYVDAGRLPAAGARRAGYRAAMRRHGRAADLQVISGGEGEDDGARVARELVDQGLPDAVITYNDRCAVGVLDVFARLGIAVPEQISVVGYDDSQIARLSYLQLTTVSQDIAVLARLAVQRAVDRLEGRPVDDADLVVTPHLVVRGTTAARSQ